MAFDGSGSFVRLYNWVQDRINGIKIRADRMDAEMDGMATGLSNTICRDGQSTTTAAIPFAQGIQTDTVDEESAGAGVTIDSVLLKDGRVDWSKASDVASAGTASIGAIDGNYVVITGTTTITSFGTGTAGMTRIVRFSGALTLTHNGTSLILATGADRTTAAGDEAIFVCEGSSNWREVLYHPAGGVPGLTKPNVFTADQTIRSTDAGAAAGPFIIAHRDSASPAANDLLGGLQIDGEDDAGNQETYADILAEILDPGSGSEDARIWLRSVVAGTLANRLGIGQGIWTPNATGGDQGADTANFSAYYRDGVESGVTEKVESIDISTNTASWTAAAAMDADYIYKLIVEIKPQTDGADLYFRTDTDSGASDYRWQWHGTADGTHTGQTNISDTKIGLDAGSGNDSFAGDWLEMTIFPADGTHYDRILWDLGNFDASLNRAIVINGSGWRASTTAGKKPTLLYGTDNIAFAKGGLYRIAK